MPNVSPSYLHHILATLRPLERKLTRMADRSQSWDEPLFNIRAIIQETEKARLLPEISQLPSYPLPSREPYPPTPAPVLSEEEKALIREDARNNGFATPDTK